MGVAIKLNIVRDGGAAFKAGLRAGDLLIRYNGDEISSADSIAQEIEKSSGEVGVSFVRDGALMSATVQSGPLGISYAEVELGEIPEWAVNESLKNMIVTTAPSIEGSIITEQLGVISSECVFGLNVFKDFFSSMSDAFGGRSKTTQSALREAREACIAELKREALDRGANAIVAVDLDYSEFSGQGKSMLFIVATGTAVQIEKSSVK